jgi:hypothetical protein
LAKRWFSKEKRILFQAGAAEFEGLDAIIGSRKIAVAVKTTGHGAPSVQWQVKPGGWTTLFKGDERPDFVVFVWFTNRDALTTAACSLSPRRWWMLMYFKLTCTGTITSSVMGYLAWTRATL